MDFPCVSEPFAFVQEEEEAEQQPRGGFGFLRGFGGNSTEGLATQAERSVREAAPKEASRSVGRAKAAPQ